MTSLQITPTFARKTAKIAGTIAAGEHVTVTVVGGNAVKTTTLYLRIVCCGKTIAQFPEPVEEGETQDTWTTSGDDITATLNLNTVEALKYCKTPETWCIAVLEDIGDAEAATPVHPQLYFVSDCTVNGWPQKRTEEEPYSLDDYPGLISQWKTMIDNLSASVSKSGSVSTITIVNKDGTTTTAQVADGTSPHIDATTGHWFIGTTDTGVPAIGQKGDTGEVDKVLEGETMKISPSQRQMTEALKKVWQSLGGTFVMCFAAMCAFGSVSTTNEWQDIPPDIRLGEVASNVVTKAYVEGLGIEAGISAETATNIAEAVVAEYDATNLTARIAERTTTNDVCAIVTNNAPDVFSAWTTGQVYQTDMYTLTNVAVKYTAPQVHVADKCWCFEMVGSTTTTVEPYPIHEFWPCYITGTQTWATDTNATSVTEGYSLSAFATSTRTVISKGGNALGLAYAKDALGASAVTNIAASASVTNAGAVAYAEANFVNCEYDDVGNFYSVDKSLYFTNNCDFSVETRFHNDILIDSFDVWVGIGPEYEGIGVVNGFLNLRTYESEEEPHYRYSSIHADGTPVATSNMVNGIVPQFIDHTLPRFSNEVLAVGLNIDTNSVAVLNEIAATFGGFPVTGTATTLGGLLAALAAAIAWLKSNKRDKTDNACHQTTSGFSPWFATLPSGYTFGDAQPTFNSTTEKWTWYVEGTGVSVDAESGTSTASATSATFTFTDGEGEGSTKTFTATRFAAVESTSGENFVTKTYVSSQFTSANASLMGLLPYPLNTAGTILDRSRNVVTSGAFTIPAGFTDLVIRFTGTPVSLTFADSGITDYGDDLPSASGDYLITVTKIDTDEAYVRIIELEERTSA